MLLYSFNENLTLIYFQFQKIFDPLKNIFGGLFSRNIIIWLSSNSLINVHIFDAHFKRLLGLFPCTKLKMCSTVLFAL